MLRSASWTKIYDQDLKENAKNEIEVHYLSFETNFLTIRHNQHLNLGPGMVAEL
jgi:hypothetical protein